MKNIILLIGFVVVAGAGWYIYSQSGSVDLDLGGRSALSEAALVNAQMYIERSARISAMELNTDVLDDPLFTTLRSYTLPVPEYPIGRENPFAKTTAVLSQ